MSKKITKRARIEDYLLKHGSISPLEAINNFWATRLSGIIYDLKADGWVFKTTREVHAPSGCHFARYHLVTLPPNY